MDIKTCWSFSDVKLYSSDLKKNTEHDYFIYKIYFCNLYKAVMRFQQQINVPSHLSLAGSMFLSGCQRDMSIMSLWDFSNPCQIFSACSWRLIFSCQHYFSLTSPKSRRVSGLGVELLQKRDIHFNQFNSCGGGGGEKERMYNSLILN